MVFLAQQAGFGANLTTTNVQPGGADWNAAIWRTNSTGIAVSPVAGNSYECIPNGVAFGNGTANTRIRTPTTGVATFPGDVLTLNTNTEIRIKGSSTGPLLNFPGVAGAPGLVLNGGILNVGDNAVFKITGKVHIASYGYICPGDSGGGAVQPLRGIDLAGQLTGAGTMVIFQAGTSVAQNISGNQNTFSGRWIVKAGWLLGSGQGSLGTNSVTIDPGYRLPLDGVILDVAGPAWFEPGYDLNSAGRLTLTNGGIMVLHQDCAFVSAIINGVALASGAHSYAELAGSFPANFAAGGSGSITIRPYNPPTPVKPVITLQPVSFAKDAGSAAELVAEATGGSLFYRWQKGTNNVFTNLVDTATISGSQSNSLRFSALAAADAADYRLIVTNSAGAATSQVATVTVLTGGSPPYVTSLTPASGSIVSSLSEIRVSFSEPVVNVAAADLLINGTPANAVSGSGTFYTFNFPQPAPGLVSVFWDADNGIVDLAGEPLDVATSWYYTLVDGTGPTVLATAPAAGATVTSVTQAQVVFSEPVLGVSPDDLRVNGSPAASVSGSGSGPYVFQFVPVVQGSAAFSWAPGSNITDSESNALIASGWSVTVNAATGNAALTNVSINEFLTANVKSAGLRDEDGDLSDWVEIANRGNVAVNLAGWSLTDSASEPARWIFPATNLGPGQFMVVSASGKDRRIPGGTLHTNFKLNSGGDYLGLYNADFPPRKVFEYAPQYPEQRNDVSYGIDAGGAARYFSSPTPGAPNGLSSITGLVARVHFSVDHGFFDLPFNLHLTTATPGASIVYTTDGSEPALGVNGNLYTAPITVGSTLVLRAAAFAPGLLPTPVDTRSYLFVESIVHQPNNPPGYPTGYAWTPVPGTVQNGSRAYYEMSPVVVGDPEYASSVRSGLLSIPTMSIVLPIPDLFDPNTGIYTHPEQRGPAWERACSMELVYPDGSKGLQVDCGLQIQGGTQRDPNKNAKHSFRVSFKGDYGTGRLEHRVFPDSPVASFNTLVLDGGINMWWHYVGGSSPLDQRYRAQCVRDQFASDLMGALGQPTCHGRFHHIYLNGLYWGLHYVHERPDSEFGANYLGGNAVEYDVLRTTTAGLEVVAGETSAWDATMALVNAGLADNSRLLELQQYVDIDNLIDYMIVNHWIGNEDWPQHNWYVVRRRAPGEGFRFISWDAEHVLKTPNGNRTTATAAGSPAQIYTALRDNAEFRLQFADHVQKAFFSGGVFYTDNNNPLYDPAHPERNMPAALYMRRITEIDTAIVDESARWGGYTLTTNYTRNRHWLRELNNLLGYTNNAGNTANFFPGRTATVLGQYKTLGLFPSVSAPVFNQNGGAVPAGFSLTMANPNAGGVIYYTTNGTDPRSFGSGSVSPDARPYGGPLMLTTSLVIKARVLQNGVWSAQSRGDFSVAELGLPLRITEIMYRPIGGDAYEYLELQNCGATSIDLSGFSFKGITFVFPEGSVIGAGACMVLASSVSPAEFASRYPGVAVAGYYGGALYNNGEYIALLDPNLTVVTSVHYDNSDGWPTQADNGGFSLEILDPNGDPNDPANWRASLVQNGSPGLVNPPATLAALRINEIMADNAGAVTNGGLFPDWLEIYNAGSATVNLANWSLANGGDPRKFVFPSGTSIGPNAYLVVWCDTQTNAPGLHTGFALGRKGETLFLYDPQTNRVDAVGFGLQAQNYSIGRVGPDATWQLNTPTPGRSNLAATSGSSTNVALNEWLANAPSGGSDWLELFNRSTTQPVTLWGMTFGVGNHFFKIRSLSFLAPRGFGQFYADENAGPDHLDCKLSASGEAVSLYSQDGQLIDSVAFGPQPEGVSEGKLPDGAPTIVSFPGTASPGSSNYVAAYAGPLLNEVMAWNTSAVYDGGGNTPDWLELYNSTASDLSIAGMSLGRDPAAAPEFTFPAGTIIPGYGYLRVWCTTARPATTNNGPDLNAGFNLSSEGGTVCLFSASVQIVDSVTFGAQVRDQSIGRVSGTWRLLGDPTPGSGNSAAATLGAISTIRINELMADPASGDDWFELYNGGAQPVSLGGLYLTDDPSINGVTNSVIGPLSFIGPGGWVKFVADGKPARGPDHVKFALEKEGQVVRIYDAGLQLVDSTDFGRQSTGVSVGRLPDGGPQQIDFPATPTPGASNYRRLENVVINEVLTHTDLPFEDAIELYNPGPAPVPLGGWFISNSESDLKKYKIPTGLTLPAGGYRVFYEYQFNSTNASPFTLNSAHGDSVYVSQADSMGNLTGYRAQVAFGASARSVSLGRFVTSLGVDFVPLAGRTFGYDSPLTVADFRTGTGMTNAPGKTGPLVISEIMFHPVDQIGTNLIENPDEEFIEIQNVSFGNVPLYDPAAATNRWKLGGGVEYTFPGSTSVPAGTFLLVVGFDPAANPATLASFKAKYQVPANVPVLGPFSGRLNNNGETLSLLKPDSPQTAPHPDAGFVPYFLIEQVAYSNRLPWPEGADGTGMSLQRRLPSKYGNEPLNWLACVPSAGLPNCGLDSDNDGLPDAWEIANGLDPYSATGPDGANGDPDGDGFSNAQEYQAGTHPKRSDSYLKIDFINIAQGGVEIGFTAVAGHSYSIQYCEGAPGGTWIKLADVEPPAITTSALVTDILPAGALPRFYRLATPTTP